MSRAGVGCVNGSRRHTASGYGSSRNDFAPAHSQAAQRTGVTLAFILMGLVIDARLVRAMAAKIDPQMNCVAEEAVALVA